MLDGWKDGVGLKTAIDPPAARHGAIAVRPRVTPLDKRPTGFRERGRDRTTEPATSFSATAL
jgi:hypothetical protein